MEGVGREREREMGKEEWERRWLNVREKGRREGERELHNGGSVGVWVGQ